MPIYVPLSRQLEKFKQLLQAQVTDLRQTLGSHIETLESRIAILETDLSAPSSTLR